MAFSITVRGRIDLGGGLTATYGEWDSDIGDLAGTFSTGASGTPIPIMAIFQKFDALDNTYEIIPRVEYNSSNGTLTIENQDDAETGRFFIIELGY